MKIFFLLILLFIQNFVLPQFQRDSATYFDDRSYHQGNSYEYPLQTSDYLDVNNVIYVFIPQSIRDPYSELLALPIPHNPPRIEPVLDSYSTANTKSLLNFFYISKNHLSRGPPNLS